MVLESVNTVLTGALQFCFQRLAVRLVACWLHANAGRALVLSHRPGRRRDIGAGLAALISLATGGRGVLGRFIEPCDPHGDRHPARAPDGILAGERGARAR
jgi:hypothetical protein